MIRRGKTRALGLDEPLRHPDHKKPVTRRDFLAQGFLTGSATVVAPTPSGLAARIRACGSRALRRTSIRSSASAESLLARARSRSSASTWPVARVSQVRTCWSAQQGGQLDLLIDCRLLEAGSAGQHDARESRTRPNFIDTQFGLAFHSDSAFLRGMLTRTAATAMANDATARSFRRAPRTTPATTRTIRCTASQAPAPSGELLTLIGSQQLGLGRQLDWRPSMMIDPTVRPTKVDRTSDATGLVDTGELGTLLGNQAGHGVGHGVDRAHQQDEARHWFNTQLGNPGDADTKQLTQCGYVKTAYLADKFGNRRLSILPPIRASQGSSGHLHRRQYTAIVSSKDCLRDETGRRRICRSRHDFHGWFRLPHGRSLHG